jgi:hypothetical protein
VTLDDPRVRSALVGRIASALHTGAGVCQDRATVLVQTAIADVVASLEPAPPDPEVERLRAHVRHLTGRVDHLLIASQRAERERDEALAQLDERSYGGPPT